MRIKIRHLHINIFKKWKLTSRMYTFLIPVFLYAPSFCGLRLVETASFYAQIKCSKQNHNSMYAYFHYYLHIMVIHLILFRKCLWTWRNPNTRISSSGTAVDKIISAFLGSTYYPFWYAPHYFWTLRQCFGLWL